MLDLGFKPLFPRGKLEPLGPPELKVEITRYVIRDSEYDPYAAYVIKSTKGSKVAEKERRFREFERLNKSLKKLITKDCVLPSASSKIGVRNLTPEFLDSRVKDLDAYLQNVIKIPGIQDNEDFQKFIGFFPVDPLDEKIFEATFRKTKWDLWVWGDIKYDEPRDAISKLITLNVWKDVSSDIYHALPAVEAPRRASLKLAYKVISGIIDAAVPPAWDVAYAASKKVRGTVQGVLESVIGPIIEKKNDLNKKTIKSKKLNLKNISNERFHSSDINGRNKEQKFNKKNFINKKTNKKIFKLDLKKRINVKTPSPLNYRQSSPLLIDHDTIIRNKNKKINYNGNYYNEHFNKGFKKKISHPNLEKNKKNMNNHYKLKSNEYLNKKDITKEEEQKLNEQILNTSLNDVPLIKQNNAQINNTKNIMDLSQNILQNLELMNHIDVNKNEIINEMNQNKNNSNKKVYFSLKKNYDNLFMSNHIESLYLSILLGFFSPWDKLKLLLLSKELFFKIDLKDIINDYIIYFENQINLINKKINKYEINIINKPFNPRKTGLNSLNFITKNEEQRLINETQHNYVLKIFEIIIILSDG